MTRTIASRAAVALLAVAAASCSRRPEPDGPWRSVLLVTVDTLRADRLGAYGHDRDTSPALDALAARGARFERALVPTPRTTQSLASLLTGQDPLRHGVRLLTQSLDDASETVAERFRDAGYRTGAFVVVPFFTPALGPQGLDQGFESFDTFDDRRGFARDARAEEVADAAIRWIDERGDEPWFLWVHLRDPHAPYWNHPGDAAEGCGLADALTPDYSGPWNAYFHYWAVKPNGRPAGGALTKAHQDRKGRLKFGHDRLSDADVERAIALYDGEIRYTDHHFGRMLAALETRGRADDTVVVFSADHGESLGEHDFWFDHGEFLYDPTLRVPLVVHAPTRPATVVDGQVGTIDVAPTLLDLFGLAPFASADGRSFAAALDGAPFPGRSLFAESGEPLMAEHNPRFAPADGAAFVPPSDPNDRLRAAALTDHRKLILDPRAAPGSEWELYAIADDPRELADLATDPASLEPLARPRDMLKKIAAEDTTLAPTDLTDEALKRLHEQGYLLGKK
ncbi:MAG: sulfatase [Planctomycetota bacterium JB042]